jgi:DNA invertase Pin-like site-specific DNA recombinase
MSRLYDSVTSGHRHCFTSRTVIGGDVKIDAVDCGVDLTQKKKKRKQVEIEIPAEYEDQVSELLVQLMMADNDPEEKGEEKEKPQDDKADYEVRKVTDHHITSDGVWQFLVHFKGERAGVWIDDDDCNCEKLIKSYFRSTGNKTRTVYCICRVSSKNQTGPKHVSLEAQGMRLLRAVNERFGSAPSLRVKMLKISASAYRGIPTVLKRIGESASAGDAILTYRVDRLSRNIVKFLSFLEELNDRGVLLYAQDENLWYHEKKLEFIQGILDANKEAVIIGKRVKLSLERRQQRGDEVFGSVRYGYRINRDKDNRVLRVRNVAEQNVIRRIESEYQNGKTASEIARILNASGVKKRGRTWTAGMVHYTFANR